MALKTSVPKSLRGPIGLLSIIVALLGAVIGYIFLLFGVSLYFQLVPQMNETMTQSESLVVIVTGWLGGPGACSLPIMDLSGRKSGSVFLVVLVGGEIVLASHSAACIVASSTIPTISAALQSAAAHSRRYPVIRPGVIRDSRIPSFLFVLRVRTVGQRDTQVLFDAAHRLMSRYEESQPTSHQTSAKGCCPL
ncbi:hypothetical protein [Haladaptatus sp. W1]|uniref:hypothetical protein n=1 Tax=Haladaptatus sp. W1 TaxID=1897478 RepID=UPI000A68EE5E|nr:hypothetical protein [Haladaptatus sp. W1]